MEKYRPLPDIPAKRSMGPLRFVERSVTVPGSEKDGMSLVRPVRILQEYIWREFSPEYLAETDTTSVRAWGNGEYVWSDVPLEEE